MNNKQRLNRKIVKIIIILIGIYLIFGCITPKAACPTYDSAIKGKVLKKKNANKAWNSDFCHVKKKKRKSIF